MPGITPKRVIIVGGGVAGLAAAWRVRQSLKDSLSSLLVLDAAPRAGGFLKTTSREGFMMEMGADCFISEKPRGVGLCRELGLEEELISTNPNFRRSFILRDNTFYPVPEGFYLMGPSRARPFLESGLLSWPGKLRVMCEPLMPSRDRGDESLASFVRRRFGQELLDWMAQPLIAGIYGANPEQLSLRATFPQFLTMERTFGSVIFGLKKTKGAVSQASGARYGLFVTLKRGMQSLPDTLVAKLGASVVLSQTRIKGIRHDGTSWQVIKASGEILTADAVCLALPSYTAAELVNGIDPDLAAELSSISYAPAATLNMAFRELDVKRPLGGVGFVVPQKEHKLVLGCTMVQNKFDGRVPKGFVLMRAFLGGEQASAWLSEKDETLTQKVYAELQGWLGLAAKPMFTHLERYERALPQYTVGHLERVVGIEERLLHHKGLALAGNYQYGVGVPDCIASGERAADQLIGSMATASS